MRRNNLEYMFRSIEGNAIIFLRLYVNSLDNAVKAMTENNTRKLVEWTWASVENLVKYLSSRKVRELFSVLREKIVAKYRERNIEVDDKIIVDSLVPRMHKSIRPRAYVLENIDPELKGLYEMVVWAEPLFLTIHEGYEDEDEIREIALRVLSKMQEISKKTRIF